MSLDKLSALIELDKLNWRVTFSREIYSDTAVKVAVYKFADRMTVVLVPTDGSLVAEIRLPESSDDGESLIQEFMAEVIDQDLREQIKAQTEPVRNLILAEAFSKTSLIQDN